MESSYISQIVLLNTVRLATNAKCVWECLTMIWHCYYTRPWGHNRRLSVLHFVTKSLWVTCWLNYTNFLLKASKGKKSKSNTFSTEQLLLNCCYWTSQELITNFVMNNQGKIKEQQFYYWTFVKCLFVVIVVMLLIF